MAFRLSTRCKAMLDRLGGKSNIATSTSPKMKAYSPAVDRSYGFDTKPQQSVHRQGDFVPVYVSLGMIMLAASLGLFTIWHQLKHNPSVQVKKSRRETITEVTDPDLVVSETDKFIKTSLFRKVANIQDHGEPNVPDYIRGEAMARPARAETLKTVGVNPKIHG